MEELKVQFESNFPATTDARTPGPARAGGSCDFTVDGGKVPLDLARVIDLPAIPAADFTTPRRGGPDWSCCPGL